MDTMRTSRFAQEQIFGVLQEHEARQRLPYVVDSKASAMQTLCRWTQKFGSLGRGNGG